MASNKLFTKQTNKYRSTKTTEVLLCMYVCICVCMYVYVIVTPLHTLPKVYVCVYMCVCVFFNEFFLSSFVFLERFDWKKEKKKKHDIYFFLSFVCLFVCLSLFVSVCRVYIHLWTNATQGKRKRKRKRERKKKKREKEKKKRKKNLLILQNYHLHKKLKIGK